MLDKNCLQCGKAMKVKPSQLKKGRGKHCSYECRSKTFKGEGHPNWKGDSVGYFGIHDWLYSEYGNASRCENKNCSGDCKTFEWAKRKGVRYMRRRENFIQMCVICHRSYDGTMPINKWVKDKTIC